MDARKLLLDCHLCFLHCGTSQDQKEHSDFSLHCVSLASLPLSLRDEFQVHDAGRSPQVRGLRRPYHHQRLGRRVEHLRASINISQLETYTSNFKLYVHDNFSRHEGHRHHEAAVPDLRQAPHRRQADLGVQNQE